MKILLIIILTLTANCFAADEYSSGVYIMSRQRYIELTRQGEELDITSFGTQTATNFLGTDSPITSIRFAYPTGTNWVETHHYSSNTIVNGYFYTKWECETNNSPTRRTMEGFPPETGLYHSWVSNHFYLNVATNVAWHYLLPPPCEKDHFDGSEQTETTYVHSNLVSYLVWRGRTNMNILESLCVRTNVRKWRYERTKVYQN